MRLNTYDHRVYKSPQGIRLMCYARGQLVPDGPEEHVRQNVLRSLVEVYGYPRRALLAEEPVARGTRNRRRADVLVELPTREVTEHKAHVVPTPPTGANTWADYDELVRAAAQQLADVPGLRFFEV